MARQSFGYGSAFCVCLAVFIGATITAVHEANSTLAHLQRIQQAQNVVESVTTNLDQAVANERGYMVTGNSSFLLAYNRAKTRLLPALRAMGMLLPASANDNAEFARLNSAIALKTAAMDRVIALYQQGNRLAAAALVDSPGNLALMPQIRAQTSKWRAAVTSRMQRSVNQGIAISRLATLGSVFGGIAILLLLASAVRALVRTVRRERAAFEARHATEQLLTATLLGIGDGVIATDTEGRITLMNAAAERLTGWKLDEVRARHCDEVLSLTYGDGSQPTEQVFGHVRRAGVPLHVSGNALLNARHRRAMPVEVRGAPINAPDGSALGVVVSFHDITNRLQTEQNLRSSEERYRLMFESNPTAMWMLDIHTLAYLDVNEAAVKQYGYSREEFLAMTVDQMVLTADVPRLLDFLTNQPAVTLNAGIRRHQRKDGSVFPVEMWSRQLTIDGRKVRLALAIDRTEVVQAREALEALNITLEHRVSDRTAALEQTNTELQAFIDAAAHDLKAPARWVEGYSRAILEDFGDKLESDVRAKIERIQWSGRLMTQFVDGLYRLTFVSRLEIRNSCVDVAEIAECILTEMQDAEPDRQVTVNIDEKLTAWGDEALLTIVLTNLLGNAWKFTRNRVPTVISVERADDEDGLEVFVVRDNGAGFDQASAKKAFGLFQRLHSRDQFEGTGVGLATAQRIINRHGGRIRGEGRVNEGAAFFVALPREV